MFISEGKGLAGYCIDLWRLLKDMIHGKGQICSSWWERVELGVFD